MQNGKRAGETGPAPAAPSFRILYRAFFTLVLLFLCGFLFFYRLSDRDLWSSHEARAAMDAQGVLDGSHVLVPHLFDGQPELQKPPLYYWLVAAIGACEGGVDEAAVRLPAAVAAVGCVSGLAALGWLCGMPRVGFLAAVVLATAGHFTWLARIGRIDMPLTLTTGVAAVAAFLALRNQETPSRPLLAVAYLAAALGVLLKGPIGFVLPAAVVGAYLLCEGEFTAVWRGRAWWDLSLRLGVWWGVPLVLVLTVPWFVAADVETGGEFTRVFFWRHNLERALGSGPLRRNPLWFYGPQFVVDFLPWSPLVAGAVVVAWRRGLLRDDPLARFGLAWFVGIFAVLSCAGFKRADYLLPAYPGAALFLACAATRTAERTRHGWVLDRAVPALLASGMVVFWGFRVGSSLPAEEPFRDYRSLAAIIRGAAPQPAEVVFFRTESHALAFRVGRPLAVLVEWSDLKARLDAPGAHYVVTPPGSAAECRRSLPGVCWENVSGTAELAGGSHERPLLLLRATHPAGLAAAVP